MNYLLVGLCVLFMCTQEFLKKSYLIRKKPGNEELYNFCSVLCAIPVFIMINGGIYTFHLPTFFYSCGYATCYAMALIFSMKALKCGSLALTTMVLSLSFVMQLFVGVFVFNDPINIFSIISIILMIAVFVVMNGGKQEEEENKVSTKWLIYVILGAVGNGGAGIVVKFHRVNYPGEYSSELMITAMFIVLLICLFFLIKKTVVQGNAKIEVKETVIFAFLTGLANGISNLISVLLMERMPLLEQTMLQKGGLFILTYLVSVVFYREKMTKRQKIAFLLGVVATLLFNIK